MSRRRPFQAAFLYRALVAAVFICSWLLFSLEPMIARQLLPRLGGSAAVWITCLLFFQAALLAGYAYAHISLKLLGVKKQALLHAMLVIAALAWLPISTGTASLHPGVSPVLWLLGTLSLSIGLPFVVLASFGPLAQRWVAHFDANGALDPYHMYAASNAGSLLALLAYPFVVEPFLGLHDQAVAWSIVFAVLSGAVLLVSLLVARRGDISAARHRDDTSPPVTASDRSKWIVYAAVPSSMLMGTTAYISTDIGTFPLLWIIPLSLYLLTYTLVFAKRAVIPHRLMIKAEPQAIVLVALTMYWGIALPGVLNLILHLALLFLIAMVCHGELAKSRPPTSRLTDFYLCVAVGGLLGGVFNAAIAPLIFTEHLEYPIAIALAALLRPANAAHRRTDFVIAGAFGMALLAATRQSGSPPELVPSLLMVVFGVALFSFRARPRRFALALALLFTIAAMKRTALPSEREHIASARSFFGVYKVFDHPAQQVRMLEHGTTIHGAQSLVGSERLDALTYYSVSGPAGDIFGVSAPQVRERSIGVVGLGIGSLACYGSPAEQWTFYEIDPLVATIATDSTRFTLLRDCPPQVRIVLGDARLNLVGQPNESFDILVIDAFSSDAIPVHLLTREAFAEYLRVLKRDGILAVHISNDHMDLAPLLSSLTRDLGVSARVRVDRGAMDQPGQPTRHSASVWVAMARTTASILWLREPAWHPLESKRKVAPWTDDFSNIVSIIRW